MHNKEQMPKYPSLKHNRTFMKKIVVIILTILSFSAYSQTAENIIIITTDGFRWQEIFTGMDSAIANNSKFNQGDSAAIFKKSMNAMLVLIIIYLERISKNDLTFNLDKISFRSSVFL